MCVHYFLNTYLTCIDIQIKHIQHTLYLVVIEHIAQASSGWYTRQMETIQPKYTKELTKSCSNVTEKEIQTNHKVRM